jgi:peptidyl-tRNA hydrolase, PTH1 family
MKLIVGLGNPGPEYENTRHNAGFMAVDTLAESFEFDPFKLSSKFNAELSQGTIAGEKVILTKPHTFMNLSGRAVRQILDYHKLWLPDLIVIYDDVNVPKGELRIRKNGSAGGHNGMKSIIQELGSEDFVRIRLGIEPLRPQKTPLEDYVLGHFSQRGKVLMRENLEKIPGIIQTLLEKGVEKAMSEYN